MELIISFQCSSYVQRVNVKIVRFKRFIESIILRACFGILTNSSTILAMLGKLSENFSKLGLALKSSSSTTTGEGTEVIIIMLSEQGHALLSVFVLYEFCDDEIFDTLCVTKV